MSPKNIFGRSLPEYIRHQPEESHTEKRESTREQMYERILHDAKIVQGFIMQLDAFTIDMGPEEIVRRLNAEKERALASVPGEFVEDVRRWMNIREKMRDIGGDVDDDDGMEMSDEDWEELFINDEYLRLQEEEIDLFEKIHEDPHFEMVYHIETWTNVMGKAVEEIGALNQDPELARQAVNELTFFRRQEKILKPQDIIRTSFEPFCVQFEISPKAFKPLQSSPDVTGFHIKKTSFIFLKEERSKGMGREHEIKHESGHRILDTAPSHGNANSIDGILLHSIDRYREAQKNGSEIAAKKGIREVLQRAGDETHNEFLAELNFVRSLAISRLFERHWSTAEKMAERFSKRISRSIEEVQKIDPKFARELRIWASRVYPRFIKAKMHVLRALRVAYYLKEKGIDEQAPTCVTALAFVMPVRSYMHIMDVLKRVYGEGTIISVTEKEPYDELRYGSKIPSMKELSIFLEKRDREGGTEAIDWSEVFSTKDEACLSEWGLHSLSALSDCLAEMQKWPRRFISDPDNNPMKEVANAFFSERIDNIWRTGKASRLVSASKIACNPYIRDGFLTALRVSFDTGLYAEDLAGYLNKGADEEVTRSEVLTSPMAEYCKDAGCEKEFLEYVDEFLPKEGSPQTS